VVGGGLRASGRIQRRGAGPGHAPAGHESATPSTCSPTYLRVAGCSVRATLDAGPTGARARSFARGRTSCTTSRRRAGALGVCSTGWRRSSKRHTTRAGSPTSPPRQTRCKTSSSAFDSMRRARNQADVSARAAHHLRHPRGQSRPRHGAGGIGCRSPRSVSTVEVHPRVLRLGGPTGGRRHVAACRARVRRGRLAHSEARRVTSVRAPTEGRWAKPAASSGGQPAAAVAGLSESTKCSVSRGRRRPRRRIAPALTGVGGDRAAHGAMVVAWAMPRHAERPTLTC
jgi:hypothetical protein